jgi:hypothetical protein
MLKTIQTALLAAATLSALSVGAHAVERTIDLKDIKGPLVPIDHYRGDREFGGNGPYMRVETQLAIIQDGRAIAAYISFDARERGGDYSSVRGNWTKVIWRTRDGARVRRILSKERESVAGESRDGGGFSMEARGADRHQGRGGPMNILSKDYGYLRGAQVVGDTDGDDISTDLDPRGDTAIYLVDFGQLRVEMDR